MATILHVDMDAFFASVEVRSDPSLVGRPVIVGGSGRRGVVAAASYEARAYGVRSAMPASQARRLCPQAVFVSGNYDRYVEVSRQIHDIFQAYTPVVEGIALDEAFLDVTGAAALFGDGATIAHRLRAHVQSDLGLSSSVGVAATKFVAKLASEAAKPRASPSGPIPGRGVVVVEAGQELAFLHPLPVGALWGVGPVTASRLQGLGVATIGQLAAVPLDALERAVGSASGRHLHELSWARDPRHVEPDRVVQSIGHEETYPWDRDDRVELQRDVVRMADAVASRLRVAGVTGRTVTLKLRYGDFTTITRSRTLSIGIDTGPAIAHAVGMLLDQVAVDPGVRLLGVSVANLAQGAPQQLSLALGPARSGRGGDTSTPSAPVSAARMPVPGPAPGVGAATAATRSSVEPASGSVGSHRAEGRVVAEPVSSESADLAWHDATRAVDRIRARFGDAAVGPAVLLDRSGLRLKRAGDTQWGPSVPVADEEESDPPTGK